MSSHLSSYSARHTWATMAYYCEIHPGIISEAMGHSSINVTETYLKPFNDKKIDEANEKVISFVKSNGISAQFFCFLLIEQSKYVLIYSSRKRLLLKGRIALFVSQPPFLMSKYYKIRLYIFPCLANLLSLFHLNLISQSYYKNSTYKPLLIFIHLKYYKQLQMYRNCIKHVFIQLIKYRFPLPAK